MHLILPQKTRFVNRSGRNIRAARSSFGVKPKADRTVRPVCDPFRSEIELSAELVHDIVVDTGSDTAGRYEYNERDNKQNESDYGEDKTRFTGTLSALVHGYDTGDKTDYREQGERAAKYTEDTEYKRDDARAFAGVVLLDRRSVLRLLGSLELLILVRLLILRLILLLPELLILLLLILRLPGLILLLPRGLLRLLYVLLCVRRRRLSELLRVLLNVLLYGFRRLLYVLLRLLDRILRFSRRIFDGLLYRLSRLNRCLRGVFLYFFRFDLSRRRDFLNLFLGLYELLTAFGAKSLTLFGVGTAIWTYWHNHIILSSFAIIIQPSLHFVNVFFIKIRPATDMKKA